MLSPATFIGIANASAPVGHPAPGAGRSGNVQQARVLPTPPAAVPIMQQPPKSAAPTASSTPQTPPPRNLPRGSLLDLSV
jgi:hypothetical protein